MKTKTIYLCQACGAKAPKWAGQCPDCGAWNTLQEETVSAGKHARGQGYAGGAGGEVTSLTAVPLTQQTRIHTGSPEFDQVLGGGLVPGAVILLGGNPGIGKSTILLQTICHLANDFNALYITGEESLEQVSLRAKRLGLLNDKVNLLLETKVEHILEKLKQLKPQILVVDSIQTVYSDMLSSAPGSVSQVREAAAQLTQYAKQTGCILFLVGHVTKEGAIAGPRVLEHMVDGVLYFEGEGSSRYRLIRAVKNRFGAVNELAIFAMTETGLKEVSNPSAIFLSSFNANIPGSVVMVTWEGTRPLLVEVQALVDESHLGNPRRVTVGLEQNRLAMLLAVMHRHGGVVTHDQDVFANVVGGVRISETASDLALALAIHSSLRNQSLGEGLIVFGEMGLSGEIRPVQSGQERIKEAAKHGFTRAIVPKGNLPKKAPEGMTLHGVSHIQEALACL